MPECFDPRVLGRTNRKQKKTTKKTQAEDKLPLARVEQVVRAPAQRVHRRGGGDAIQPETAKRAGSGCVSVNSFGFRCGHGVMHRWNWQEQSEAHNGA